MKSKIVSLVEKEESLSYPRLKRSTITGIVTLFTSEFNGIYVYVPEIHTYHNPIGKSISTDAKANFYWKDFTGTIELSN